MQRFTLTPIGHIEIREEGMFVRLEPEYIPALEGLNGFSHINVFWWFHELDAPEYRNILAAPQPYKNAPETMGIFATRSPIRPNPIALSTTEILNMDTRNGRIQLAYIDAHDGSPVVDMKPYTPSLDRVEEPQVPAWCAHWPKSLEESGRFDWSGEFNF